MRRDIGVERAQVEDAAHAVAVAHRKAAGVDLGIADQLRVDHAEDVVVGGQVKGFAQRETVEQREQFTRLAAADVGLRAEPALGHARQPPERAHASSPGAGCAASASPVTCTAPMLPKRSSA